MYVVVPVPDIKVGPDTYVYRFEVCRKQSGSGDRKMPIFSNVACTREGLLRSLFKSVFYPPKSENRVKMSDGRIFLDFFLEQRVLRFHRGIVRPPAAIIDRATRADPSDDPPPVIG